MKLVLGEDMSEKELQAAVAHLARTLGLYHYHTHDSRRSEAGFLDSTIIGDGGIWFYELKTKDGKVSPAQRDVIDRLKRAGANVGVRRPIDLLNGTIGQELRAIRRRPRVPQQIAQGVNP